jgi:hypothetical protein
MENIIIGIIFVAALAYLGRIVYRQFTVKNASCAKNCGGACGVKIDFPEEMK